MTTIVIVGVLVVAAIVGGWIAHQRKGKANLTPSDPSAKPDPSND